MKRNAIVRIIVFSLVLLILVPALITGIAAGTFAVRVHYGEYTTGSSQVSAQDIREIEIEWASGTVTVETADTDVITFQEVMGKNDEPMIYRVDGDKLIIAYEAPKIHFGFGISTGKDLTVTVPRNWDCRELIVDSASAELTVNNLTAGEIDLNTASGSCEFNRCNVTELSIDSASAQVHFTGTLSSLDCDTASGDITAAVQNVPKSIDFDGASADLELTLPEEAGFTLELDSISGEFISEFAAVRQNDRYVCGDGSCHISIDGASGNVTIHKG